MTYTNSLLKTVFSVKPLFRRFQRFEKSLYGLKRPIFESESVLSALNPFHGVKIINYRLFREILQNLI